MCVTSEKPVSGLLCQNTSALMSYVQRRCDGLRSCSASLTERNFDDPCAGTWKSLDVYYTCTQVRSHRADFDISKIARYPEGTFMNLCCSERNEERILYIRNATYRMRSYYARNSPHGLRTQTGHCTRQDALSTVRGMCQERTSCIVPAITDIPGDPCVGLNKVLETEYFCTRMSRVCEHSNLSLSCPWGEIIRIVDGFYGRELGSELCPHPIIDTKNCREASSLSVIKKRCHNQQSCTLSASNDVFGDPCVHTYKYLEVYYVCVLKVLPY